MVVIVTGASAGIGYALAVELASRGARLVLAARRLKRLEALNRELGGGHLCVEADVSRPLDCETIIRRAMDRFGRIDTLICNAGFGFIRPAAETTAADLLAIFETNVLGATECIRHAMPIMAAQELRDGWRGQMMLVSSGVGRHGLPLFGAYSATKAAQIAMAESMRVELRPQRIAVTTVIPVGTDTGFFRTAVRRSGVRPPRRSAIEVHQTPQDVALAIIKGIQRPRAEVWPARSYRWLLALMSLFPGTTDAVVARRSVASEQPAKPTAKETRAARAAATVIASEESEVGPGVGVVAQVQATE